MVILYSVWEAWLKMVTCSGIVVVPCLGGLAEMNTCSGIAVVLYFVVLGGLGEDQHILRYRGHVVLCLHSKKGE